MASIYPSYDVDKVQTNGRRARVWLKAGTKCGPKIEAHSTIVADNDTPAALRDAAAKAREWAERNLMAKHDAVVRTCKKRGTHTGH